MKKFLAIYVVLFFSLSFAYSDIILKEGLVFDHFLDVSSLDNKFLSSLTVLNKKGIVPDSPYKKFYPDKAITFEEFSTWLFKAANKTESKLEDESFFDIPEGYWRYNHIKYMLDNKMIYIGFRGILNYKTKLSGADFIRIISRYEELFYLENNIPKTFDVRPELLKNSDDIHYTKKITKQVALKYFLKTSYVNKFVNQ